jgi:hypothetical protein
MTPRCYALRLLFPFRGLVQVAALESGEAEGGDGLHWIVYLVSGQIVTHTGLSALRCGTWAPATAAPAPSLGG